MGRPAGSKKPTILPVDRCLSTASYSIRLLTPAVCANGTRAKWARYEGSKCNYGEITYADGLLDVRDEDLRECKDMKLKNTNGETNVGSMSFWCEGFGEVERPDPNAPPKEEKPKPRAGSVSESACGNRAPFFNHPKTDTCVNLATKKLKIYSSGVCEDGTPGRWAKYEDKDCVGESKERLDVGDDLLKRCLDVDGTKSFAFWCTGEGLGGKPKDPPSQPKKSSSVGLIVVLVILGIGLLGGLAFLGYAFRDRIQVSASASILMSRVGRKLILCRDFSEGMDMGASRYRKLESTFCRFCKFYMGKSL